MRVTLNSIIDTVSSSLQTNLGKLQSLQDGLSSGKRIRKPSDDPINTAKLVVFKTKQNQYDQYSKVIAESKTWLTMTENAIDQVNNIIMEIRQACIESGNASVPDSARQSIILRIQQLKEGLMDESNSKYMNKYIFSGLKTMEKPFEETAGVVSYNGDTGGMAREISYGSSIEINFNGADVFNMSGTAIPGDPNTFEIIDNLVTSLQAGDIDNISNVILAQVDRAHENIVNIYSEIGSRVNRLDLTGEQNENNMFSITEMISVIEDIDIAEAVMDLKKAEVVYQNSLNVAGRLLPLSLLDFLK
ncbi:MAG: flagellar hook-associated protein FlgL [Actinobacteria bacterium]|nr:flagellar hook-associated protein FlgL [Actinomycetota bacterium]